VSSWHRTRLQRLRRKLAFAVVMGLSDGILNALVLASATVLRGVGLQLSLAVRVGAVALASAWFTLFVAQYAQYRLELVRAERQLMFTSSGRLAATRLGRAVIRDALAESTSAALASFVGASFPLAMGVGATGQLVGVGGVGRSPWGAGCCARAAGGRAPFGMDRQFGHRRRGRDRHRCGGRSCLRRAPAVTR
jgi:hypothetical protein